MSETSRYHLVPRVSEDDSEAETSPHEQLLPGTNITRRTVAPTWTLNLDPVIALRILNSILAIIIFVFWVIDGDGEFISACIFTMFIILLNIIQLLNFICSDVLQITVDLRRQAKQISLGHPSGPPRVSMYFDVGFSLALLLSIIIGNAVKHNSWGGSLWMAGVIIGYIVVGLQVALALPQLANKRLTLTAKLSSLNGKPTPDTKSPLVKDQTPRESARRRTIEREMPGTDAGHLV